MKQDATWYGGRPRPRRQDGDPAPPRKGAQHPTFWPMSIMAKRQDGSRCQLVRRETSSISATAESSCRLITRYRPISEMLDDRDMDLVNMKLNYVLSHGDIVNDAECTT